jgi:hypothetical protein
MDPFWNLATCDCSINYHSFGSFSPRSNLDRDYKCQAVYNKGPCGFRLLVEAGQYGSNRFNIDIDTKLKSLQKILNITQKAFSPYRSQEILRNWHGLGCGSMRVEPGRCGFVSVWTRFEILLCVTVALVNCFDPCGPASNSWFTRTDPKCRPTVTNIKEKLKTFHQKIWSLWNSFKIQIHKVFSHWLLHKKFAPNGINIVIAFWLMIYVSHS